tara:strand:- start:5868 stop:6224 length:357 start_codon:yes stop_codon:yes gene_type:complete
MKYLTIFSGVSFIFYGILALVSKKMILEYNRWGYAELRFLIGALQLLGGLGLLLGLYFNLLIPLSSASLMLLMLAAIGVRFNIKEQSIKMLPALFFAIIIFLILINSVFKKYEIDHNK